MVRRPVRDASLYSYTGCGIRLGIDVDEENSLI